MDNLDDPFSAATPAIPDDIWHTFTIKYGKYAGKQVDVLESALIWFLERAEASRKTEVLELTKDDRALLSEFRIGVD